MRRAPVRFLNPSLGPCVERSGLKKTTLQSIGGWPYYTSFYEILRAGTVIATPLTIARLERVAAVVGFPTHEIFLDETAQ